MCGACIDKETCGIFVTTRSAKAAKNEKDKKENQESDKDRLTSTVVVSAPYPSPIIMKAKDAIKEQKEKRLKKNKKYNDNKNIVTAEERIMRENEYYKAMRRSVKKNIFEEN